MKPSTGICTNAECSQFGLEKSFDVAMFYGYAEGPSAICPECESPLQANRNCQKPRRAIMRFLQYVSGN